MTNKSTNDLEVLEFSQIITLPNCLISQIIPPCVEYSLGAEQIISE